MTLLKSLFKSRPSGPSPMERTRNKVQSFLRPSRALVDSRNLNVPAGRRRLALFVYGAIHQLGERYGLEETETLAVLVSTLREDLEFHDHEVSQLVAACVNIADEPDGGELAREGAEAALQWSEGEAGSAVQRLAKAVG